MDKGTMMINGLLAAIADSDLAKAKKQLAALLDRERPDPWGVHEALFPVVHRVLNPPFINPHLAKMYAINRELAPYLQPGDITTLVEVEVEEYTRREKLPVLSPPAALPSEAGFSDIEAAVAAKDVAAAASGMKAFLETAGPVELTRQLLLLGSGFLNQSLGHSASCSAFILLEMIARRDQDPWPALTLLADYFCKGAFHNRPQLQSSTLSAYREAYLHELHRAVSGTGIAALHHTITLYCIERSRHLFGPLEYDHMLAMWSGLMRAKQEQLLPLETFRAEPLADFSDFFAVFSGHDPLAVVHRIEGALYSGADRTRLGQYLIRSVLHSYNGQYNPHYLTGLGSALWVQERFHSEPLIVLNAWHQYLDFYFTGIS